MAPQFVVLRGRYGLSRAGLHQQLYTGAWRLVRPMSPPEQSRVERACKRLPERAAQLLKLLDPEERTPGDPSEQWAEEILAESDRSEDIRP